ncbi:MAG: MAPEG family protein [Thermodesulfobacteriota bacterium]
MTIAFWCVLVAVTLPYLCFGIARNRGRGLRGERLRDNRNPRDFPNRIEGLPKRAWDAHLNAFESLPGFAAAVIIAHLVHAPQNQIDILASVWVLARVAHVAFYLTDKSTLRSSTQFISLACVLGLFVVAGLS